MPRYYFRLDGEDDDEGIDLDDDARVREAARDLFGQMIKDGDATDGSKLLVNDEAGRTVAKLGFSFDEARPDRGCAMDNTELRAELGRLRASSVDAKRHSRNTREAITDSVEALHRMGDLLESTNPWEASGPLIRQVGLLPLNRQPRTAYRVRCRP